MPEEQKIEQDILIEKLYPVQKLLEDYDSGNISLLEKTKDVYIIKYQDMVKNIQANKEFIEKMGGKVINFGMDNDQKLSSIINNLYISFGGVSIYPDFETKAAHLFYFIIKDHPFLDGNKRIACLLLMIYFDTNTTLYNTIKEMDNCCDSYFNSSHRKENTLSSFTPRKYWNNFNILSSLALQVAKSSPNEKDTVIDFIIHTIQNN